MGSPQIGNLHGANHATRTDTDTQTAAYIQRRPGRAL